jgi:hypothetical protein
MMFFKLLTQLRDITGESARTKRQLFWSLSSLSALLQAAALIALVPLLTQLFSDNPTAALPWVAALVLLLAVTWFIDVMSYKTGFELGCCILNSVEKRGIATIRQLDLTDLHGEKASKLAKLVSTAGTESLSSVIHLLFPLVQAILITPMLSLFLLGISWKLALVALITGILLIGALVGTQYFGARSEEEYADAMRELNDAAVEFAWAQPTLRTAGVSRSALDSIIKQSHNRSLRLLLWQIPEEMLFSLVLQLGLLGFSITTGVLYYHSEISGVTAAALIIVLLRIIEASGALSLLVTPLSSAARVFQEITELSTTPALATPPLTQEITPHSIQLEGLDYHYPGTTVGIHQVDLSLDKGSTTVIVGQSGSGKSTLLDVLAGLREHTTGAITFNGVPFSADQRLQHTSVMFQTTELKPGTLADNITAPAETRDAIAHHAQLSEVINKLPQGWDSTIGEGGNALSGGERQRVGLARALAKPAGLLLIDEATSAIDATNEQAIVHALDNLRGQRTMVIVTHRPALVTLADHIVVLKDGKIAEQGTMAELLDRDGLFGAMWQRWQEIEQWTI